MMSGSESRVDERYSNVATILATLSVGLLVLPIAGLATSVIGLAFSSWCVRRTSGQAGRVSLYVTLTAFVLAASMVVITPFDTVIRTT